MAFKKRPTRAERQKQRNPFKEIAELLEATPVEYRAKLYEKLERERIAESMEKSGKKKRGGWPFVSGSFEGGSRK
ncbi:hypothetical protein KW841_06490 [Pseudomonas sp. PDM28]|jgi:hypothetical protein|uniref:hypothetical protein n=1 Tax=Pseudomonas sp. PDM28 TaxID=2854770 RepID=UPI001C490628|nr:hypothetical protein [Pseudomonas sp. PDM28]MBV7551999.1 hypothetical protein [Pseudomonas sp. PDM28]